MGQQDVGKPSEASVAESTNFTLSGSQTGRPETAKLWPVEVVNLKLSRSEPKMAEKGLVLLRYTHIEPAKTDGGERCLLQALPPIGQEIMLPAWS